LLGNAGCNGDWAIEPVWADIPVFKPINGITPRSTADLSVASVLSGNNIPTSVKLKELTPEWRVMSTNGQFEFGNIQTFINLFGGGSFATNYYTKGQTVSIGSETYIVAYSLLSLVDKVSEEMSLNLSLLNLKTIGSMSNIHAFESKAETIALERQLGSLQVTNIFNPTKPTAADQPAEATDTVKPADEVKPQPPVRRKKRRSRSRALRTTR
jgi:hypothetical protein